MSNFLGIAKGRLTKDLQANTKNEGGNFTLAVDHGFKDQKTTDFIKCFVSKETFEQMQNAKVKQGSLIEVIGTVRYTSEKANYKKPDGKDAYENNCVFTVNLWSYLPTNSGGKKEEAGDKEAPAAARNSAGKAPDFSDFAGGRPVDDDEPY